MLHGRRKYYLAKEGKLRGRIEKGDVSHIFLAILKLEQTIFKFLCLSSNFWRLECHLKRDQKAIAALRWLSTLTAFFSHLSLQGKGWQYKRLSIFHVQNLTQSHSSIAFNLQEITEAQCLSLDEQAIGKSQMGCLRI